MRKKTKGGEKKKKKPRDSWRSHPCRRGLHKPLKKGRNKRCVRFFFSFLSFAYLLDIVSWDSTSRWMLVALAFVARSSHAHTPSTLLEEGGGQGVADLVHLLCPCFPTPPHPPSFSERAERSHTHTCFAAPADTPPIYRTVAMVSVCACVSVKRIDGFATTCESLISCRHICSQIRTFMKAQQ